MSDKQITLPFTLPPILEQAERIEKFKSLYLFSLATSPQTWFLIFHHGKANEVGQNVLKDLELLNQELETPEGPQCLISFSLRQSRCGKAIFIAGANVTERSDWTDEKVRVHVRQQRKILHDLRHAPLFHICLVNPFVQELGYTMLQYKLVHRFPVACPILCFD